MRRADRLFRIVQFLRGRRLTTAAWLAERLGVSRRTVYRDIEDLGRSGVPIEGEAGVGYALRHKLDLPPLMFDRDELAALELGLRFAGSYTEKPLADAAASALAKVHSVLPPVARTQVPSPVYAPQRAGAVRLGFGTLYTAAERRHKVSLSYTDPEGRSTERVVWPLAVFFAGDSWSGLCWCELREDFRSFRLERIRRMAILEERFPDVAGRRLEDYFQLMRERHDVPTSDFDPHR